MIDLSRATTTRKALVRSTVMSEEGSKRLIHLDRQADGLYKLIAEASAEDDGGSGFEADLTQAVLYAAFYEILGNTDHWTGICQRLLNERSIMKANGAVVPTHLECDPFGGPPHDPTTKLEERIAVLEGLLAPYIVP